MDGTTLESHYVTSLKEVAWGIMLVALTLVMHGFGMIWTVRVSNALKRRFLATPSFIAGMSILILTTWMITFVHILEVMVWAAFFQWKHCFPNYSEAAYFAFMDYTTVGSPYNLPLDWRLLEGMIATAGLMGFAWSTGVVLTLAQEFQDQQLLLVQQRAERKRLKRLHATQSGGHPTATKTDAHPPAAPPPHAP